MASDIHEKLVEEIRQLERSVDQLPRVNTTLIESIKKELSEFIPSDELNPRMIYANSLRDRLKKLYEFYLNERLRRIENIRWEIGPSLPSSLRMNMTEDEIKYFKEYSQMFGTFASNTQIDLSGDIQYPPQNMYVNVKANFMKGMENYPQNPGLFTAEGTVKLDNAEVQCVVRTPTIDNFVRIGVLSIVD